MLQIETQASVLNMPPALAIAGSAEDFQGFITEAGYDGIQYMPLRTPRSTRFDTLVEAGLITSLHQSWAHGSSPRALPYRMILSGLAESTERIKELAGHMQRAVPIIVHPNEQYLDNRPPTWNIDYEYLRTVPAIGPLLHQPTVEVLAAWGLYGNGMDADEAAEAMLEVQDSRGFDGIALDVHHLTAERAGMQLDHDWALGFVSKLAMLGALGGYNEVQVPVRPDFGGEKSDIEQALSGGFENTPAGELLNVIKENVPADQDSLRVTVEIPAGAFSRYDGYKSGNKDIRSAIIATLGACLLLA